MTADLLAFPPPPTNQNGQPQPPSPEMNARTNSPNDLAIAVVASAYTPSLLLDHDLRIFAASASFGRAFKVNVDRAPGRSLAQLGDEWAGSRLSMLLKATASGVASVPSYEMELARAGEAPRHLVVHAQKIDIGRATESWLFVAFSDVTEARIAEKLKDDLLREKTILLQELQHRVANSLQIIASVLMLSARRVQSEETRGHLVDAHSRVMSVATLQRHLDQSRLGEVALEKYLTDLCETLRSSMMPDGSNLKLEVRADGSVRSASESISLGLIVTELVINALKHAFPANRGGKILVDYRSAGAEWTLSVSDDGVGMPDYPAKMAPGLGTGIVEALAKQLDATVHVADGTPGTIISIVGRPPFQHQLSARVGTATAQ